MKRTFWLAMVLALVFAMALGAVAFAQDDAATPVPAAGQGYGPRGAMQGGNWADADGDGKCDNFVDADGDGKCDNCQGQGACTGEGPGQGMQPGAMMRGQGMMGQGMMSEMMKAMRGGHHRMGGMMGGQGMQGQGGMMRGMRGGQMMGGQGAGFVDADGDGVCDHMQSATESSD